MDYIQLDLPQIHQFLEVRDLQSRHLDQLDNVEDLYSFGDSVVGLSALLLLKHVDPLEEADPDQDSGDEDQDAYEACKAEQIGNHYQAKHYVVEIANNVGLYCRELFYLFDVDLHHLDQLTTGHLFIRKQRHLQYLVQHCLGEDLMHALSDLNQPAAGASAKEGLHYLEGDNHNHEDDVVETKVVVAEDVGEDVVTEEGDEHGELVEEEAKRHAPEVLICIASILTLVCLQQGVEKTVLMIILSSDLAPYLDPSLIILIALLEIDILVIELLARVVLLIQETLTVTLLWMCRQYMLTDWYFKLINYTIDVDINIRGSWGVCT